MTTTTKGHVLHLKHENRKLKAEIDRLQNQLSYSSYAGLHAEIERLKAALSVAGLWRDMGEENKRLKAALRLAADEYQLGYSEETMSVIRAALEEGTQLPAQEAWGKRRPGE